MNFGDILDAWDKQAVQTGKKRGTPDALGGSDIGNSMEEWLRTNGVYDKDAESIKEDERYSTERRRRLRAKNPDAALDLHGLTSGEAWAALENFFEESRLKELEKVLLIHGKGNHSAGEAVLKRIVLQFIEKCPYAGESGRPSVEFGGSGATWVLLKANARGK
ncbi:MAG: Smr/MutS family protein [Treponema sp.]|nr:Smr/MutS family protein [Treponema sp.]